MKIEPKKISVRELFAEYSENDEVGSVVGYSGKLDIRPPYQREFVYKEKHRNAVIDTLTKGYPLNVMYWALRDDGTFEVIDGQQRTISICRYINGDFSFRDFIIQKDLFFHNLPVDRQEQILNYELTVYICSGEQSERLEWFKTINIAGMELTNQELRNAVYSGTWVSDAKPYFSKRECAAYRIGSDYINKIPERQEYLETVIDWISQEDSECKDKEKNIDCYMSKHQKYADANELREYFKNLISWIESTFIVKRKKYMRGVDWGTLYNKFKNDSFNSDEIEDEVSKLIQDEEVEAKGGIYPYILTRDEKYLSIRSFSDNIKQRVYERQKGICPTCKDEKKDKIHWEIEEMEGDHIVAWHDNGKTVEENCQMLCKLHNRTKSGK